MNYNETDRDFDEEINKRITSKTWSSQVVSGVFSSLRNERKRRAINIASSLFPVAAAAVLFLVLMFGLDTNSNNRFDKNSSSQIEVSVLLDRAQRLLYNDIDVYFIQGF